MELVFIHMAYSYTLNQIPRKLLHATITTMDGVLTPLPSGGRVVGARRR